MAKIKLESKLIDQVYSCAQCGFCNRVCPIYEQLGWESSSPRGRMFLLKELLRNSKLDLLGKQIVLSPEIVEKFYQCTTCGACQSVCQTNIETVTIWEELRKELVKLKLGPYGAQRFFPRNVQQFHNPYGEPPENRSSWLPKDAKINPKSPIGFFVGCTCSYRIQELAVLAVKILNSIGIELNILGSDEYCCGSPLIRTGQEDCEIPIDDSGEVRKVHFKLSEVIAHNIEKIHERGIKTLIVQCAGCFKTISQDWPRFYKKPIKFKVMHISQFLAQEIKERRLNYLKPVNKTITFHDPCHLGRAMKVFDEPRFVLSSIPGVKLVEMQRTRETSRCCGAGGGVKAAFAELATKIAETRISDAEVIKPVKLNLEELVAAFKSINSKEDGEQPSLKALEEEIMALQTSLNSSTKPDNEQINRLFEDIKDKIQNETDILLKQSIQMAEKRIKEAMEVGAEIIVTSCPFCELNLTSGVKQKNSPVQIKNILEIVADALDIKAT